MNYTFVPDLFALAMLVVILLLVRRQHSEERANAWLLGLFITLLESVAHTFYAPEGVPGRLLHLTVVDCYMAAGLVFVWASGDRTIARRTRMLLLGLNGVPLMAIATAYGLNLRYGRAYAPAIVVAIAVGVWTSLAIRRSWQNALLLVVGWSAVGVLVSEGLYRNAVYWAVASVYALAAVNFYQRLPRRSTGRLAIVTGFSVWALFFLLHPWIVTHREFADLASHIWNMQKSLISIGMILVMLEEQASSNAYLAHHDELTGLPNRRMFAARLQMALEHAERRKTPLALLVLDLNGFKSINDTHGHLAGDHVLQEVAAILRKNVRATDTVARMGGDEFIILAEGLSGEASARRFSESIRNAVERATILHGHAMHVSASVGMALYPEDSRDAVKLLRMADQRMYHRKKTPVGVRAIESAMAALPQA